ncbi:MAG: carboxypeptidase regulatory-like domain-containing protein [Micromonosporaceae bacterium]|nr:carboxypeptidase regulatory-like domain-containing protein [Micromonosporaceae bacterium]
MSPPVSAGRVGTTRLFRRAIGVALTLAVAGPVPAARASAASPPAASPSAPSPSAPSWQARGYRPAGCNTAAQPDATDTPVARCFALGLATEDGRLVQQVAEPPPTALGPADIRSAYHLPDGGEGQTVAIVDAFGYEAAEADLAVFRAHYGLPPCTSQNGCFRKVDQRGGADYPPEDPGWSIETALDLDAVSSACPKCNILLVQADDNSSANLGAAVDTAAALGAVAISNSYGIAGEYPYQNRYDAHYDHPGIAVTVSSGDFGNVQSYPATHPKVVAVGGTRLERDGSARGWKETAWSDAGSGCSLYEPRPDYQADVDTGCPDKRATADISALADPETGLAVYNTLGQDGWAQWGGTSLSAPLVAAMYAVAGDPVPGTYPVTYPYRKDKAAHLNDITEGSNGWCGNQLCTARPGWDGPTGVGTPDGVAALTLGEFGRISGTVTAGKPHAALAGATVSVTDSTGATFTAVTDEAGHYTLAVPVGTYDVVATKFGYHSRTLAAVRVEPGATVAGSFALTAIPSRRLTGTVTDGSGHGWPVYARIQIDGYPGGPVYTDPFTGRYQVDLPAGASYRLTVSAVDMPGYATSTVTAKIDPPEKRHPTDVRQDVSLTVDAACTAPGYATTYHGTGTDFTGWGTGPQGGWQVTDDAGTGRTWRFDDPGGKGNLTGGSGDFAIMDGWYNPGRQDTSLVSPVADLSAETAPVIGFDTDYSAWDGQTGDVDLSLDSGATWTTVYHLSTTSVRKHVEIPIPQAAGRTGVRVRFRYQGEYDNWWQLDNVFVGSRSCGPVTGALVTGYVRDDNNGAAVIGATVTAGTQLATSQATPDDARLADGYYWLFVPGTGTTQLTVSGRNYADSTTKVALHSDHLIRRDWRLRAGHLTVHHGDIRVSQHHGRTSYRQVRLTNDGTRPLHVTLVEQDRGYAPEGGKPAAPGAPLIRTRSDTPLGSLARRGDRPVHTIPPQDATGGTAWTNLPEYPDLVMDNLVADDDGKVYSVGGTGDQPVSANGYTYDAQAKAWQRIADLPEGREAPVGAFVNGKLYVVGGWNLAGTTSTTYAYDPGTNRWSRKADLPIAMAAGAAASVDGKLYVVGGCTTDACLPASGGAYRYDPAADTWTKLADYPETVAFLACAPAGDGVVCAGGVDPGKGWRGEPTNTTYRYFAESDTWVKVGYMPYYAFGMAYAGVGGKLQIVGGDSYGTVTNQAWEFDPATGAWSALPNANNALFRGGAACGLYQVGGSPFGFNPTPLAQRLTGYDYCVHGSDVPWLSANRTELVIPAGRSVTVTIAVDASAVAGRGRYDARLALVTDTPYATAPVTVTMQVH